MQSQAADLNLLQEKIAISSDASQMEIELQSLLIQNEREAHEAEDIFEIVKTVKDKIASLERDIQTVCFQIRFIILQFKLNYFISQENDEAEKFITTLSTDDQEKYSQLKAEQNRLAKEVENITTQLNVLETRARKLEEELHLSPVGSIFWDSLLLNLF